MDYKICRTGINFACSSPQLQGLREINIYERINKYNVRHHLSPFLLTCVVRVCASVRASWCFLHCMLLNRQYCPEPLDYEYFLVLLEILQFPVVQWL